MLSIRSAAAEAPSHEALISGGRTYSFTDLADLASAGARYIAERADPATLANGARSLRVALVGTASVETIVLLYACWESGWTPMLIHPRLIPSERAQLIDDFQPDVALDESFALAALDGAPRTANFGAHATPLDPEIPAAVIYTSGTTGSPRGAVLSHRAFIASARANTMNFGWRDDDRWALSLGLGHVGGLSVVTRTLLARKTCVIAPFKMHASLDVCEVIARERITIASLAPTMVRRILDADASYRFPSFVRALLLGSAATPPRLLHDARDRQAPAYTTYGMTETCSQLATQTYGTPPDPAHGSGPPLAGAEVRFVDGEIQVRGPMLMSGYFVRGGGLKTPFVDGGWYASGDLGFMDDQGRLHVNGRKKDLLISGGENVQPLEVEQVLTAWSEIEAACVFSVPDDLWGERIVAAVVPRVVPESDAARAAWLGAFSDYAKETLAVHKRPRRVAFVEAMAMTSGNKLDRRATAAAATPKLVDVG